jgi:hypothetical protein
MVRDRGFPILPAEARNRASLSLIHKRFRHFVDLDAEIARHAQRAPRREIAGVAATKGSARCGNLALGRG